MANNDVLTEDEKGALMDSVANDSSNCADVADQDYQRFDFSRREQGLLDQLPGLELVNERHVTSLERSLHEAFRIPFEIDISATRIIKYDEFIKSVPINACINLLKLKPLSGLSLVVVPVDILSLLIDSYFGGALRESYAETTERSLTASEFSVNTRICDRFQRAIATAWHEVLELTPEHSGCETNPELLPARPGDELVVIFTFSVSVAQHQLAMQWLLPYGALESVRKHLSSVTPAVKGAAVDADWEVLLRTELLSLETELTAVLSRVELPLGKILALKPGSVIPLRMPDIVSMYIDDALIAHAEYGAASGKKAIKLVSRFKP
jgi:flagellar motor switch protein FliM